MIMLKNALFILIISSLAACSQRKSGLMLIGMIDHQPTTQIASNSWTIGCEVLDRDYADYSAYRDYLEELGAKTARLQLGWAKCEKQPGVYDFSWLKDIAADLKSKRIRPWMQFSYGNPVYKGGGEPTLAGGMPKSGEALIAWDKWVKETVRQFKTHTNYWEIWNEPNLPDKNKVIKTPRDYGMFFVRTAEIIRAEQPDAFISGLALCGMHASSFEYIKGFLAYLQETGKMELLNELTYHPYPQAPEETYPLSDSLRSLLSLYSGKINIKHGETGCPAVSGKSGILPNLPWTEISQSKWLLRRMCGDYAHKIPTSIFTIMDYSYPVTRSQGHAYTLKMGLLYRDSLKNNTVKRLSFNAVQHTVNILDDSHTNPGPAGYNLIQAADSIKQGGLCLYRLSHIKTGGDVILVWLKNRMPNNSLQKTNVKFSVNDVHFKNPVMADLLSGKVFRIGDENLELNRDSLLTLNLPLYDSPVIIAEEADIRFTTITAK